MDRAPVLDMEFCSVLAMVQAVVIAPRAEASARRALAPRRAKRSNHLYKECRGDRPVALLLIACFCLWGEGSRHLFHAPHNRPPWR